MYWGTFLATPGMNQVSVTVDPDDSVPETTYADNTFSFNFNAVSPAAGPFISYTAAQMRNAYGINSIPTFGSAAPDGSGQTIAIINGGNDPSLFADVDGFDQAMGLTTSSAENIYQSYGAASSFLNVYNQNGVNITSNIANSGSNGVPGLPTSSEESWDVEWAHAMAPGAKIDEIEFDATGSLETNVLASYALAATLPGVSAVNWSGGLSQWSTESTDDSSVFVTPSGHVGVTFVCPSNDNGANVYPSYGQGDGYYPSTSPNVLSVGGTTLTLNNDGYGGETGWSFPTPATTVNDGSAGYSQTGTWSSQVGGFGGTYSTAAAGSSSTATWTIPVSSADTGWGTELSATWTASPGNATNTTYTVYDGTAATGTVLGTIAIDEARAPAGTADGTAQFQELGVFFPTLSGNGTGTLTVVVNARSANGTVVADAIGAAQAWASTGGPALFESEPTYQMPFQTTGYRTTPDVAFDANFSADGYGGGGVTYGGGGTSLGGPCWTGLMAIINQGRVAAGGEPLNSPTNPTQALQAIYSLPATDFHDITTGYNGFFAGPGYDLVTGRGTPIANLLVPDMVAYDQAPVLAANIEYVRLDADGLHTDIWNNATASGTPAQSILLSAMTSMSYAGPAGGDTFILDFSNGDPLPASGLSFVGGAGTNTLKIIGTTGSDTASVNGSTIVLSTPYGGATITYAGANALVFDGDNSGADTLTQTAQPGGGATLTFSRPTALDTLNVTGGTLTIPANAPGSGMLNYTLGAISIASGAKLALAASDVPADQTVLTANSFTAAGGGYFDISNNSLLVNYGVGQTDPALTIRGYLTTGYNNATWTGAGISSSFAATNPGLYAIGYADGSVDTGTPALPGQILVKLTLAGDANLDGVVNFADLLAVAQNFNHTLDTHGNPIDWADGDFNYDGKVNFADLLLVAQNFNKHLAAAQAEQTPQAGGAPASSESATSTPTTEVTPETTTDTPETVVAAPSAPAIAPDTATSVVTTPVVAPQTPPTVVSSPVTPTPAPSSLALPTQETQAPLSPVASAIVVVEATTPPPAIPIKATAATTVARPSVVVTAVHLHTIAKAPSALIAGTAPVQAVETNTAKPAKANLVFSTPALLATDGITNDVLTGEWSLDSSDSGPQFADSRRYKLSG